MPPATGGRYGLVIYSGAWYGALEANRSVNHTYELIARAGSYPFPITGLVTLWDALTYVKRKQTTGSFQLQGGFEQAQIRNLRAGSLLEVVRDGQTDFLGVVTNVTAPFDETSPHPLATIRGLDLAGSILGRRVAVPPAGLAYYSVAGVAETAMCQLVSDHLTSPVETGRAIPGVVLGPLHSPPLGDSGVIINAAGEKLSDLLAKAAFAGDVGFTIVRNAATGNLEFRVYQGLDRSESQSTNPRATFSPQHGNLLKMQWTQTLDSLANVVYTQGGDTTGATTGRFIVEDESPESVAQWGRYETWLSGNNATTPTIGHLEGETALAQSVPTDQITLTPKDTSQSQYNADWALGDIVTLRNDDWGLHLNAPIVEVQVDVKQNQGELLTLQTNLLTADFLREIKRQMRAVTPSMFSPVLPARPDGSLVVLASGTPPANPVIGQVFFDWALGKLVTWTGWGWA